MARAFVSDVYAGYRFILRLPQRDEWFGARAVFNDVFTGDLWVGAAHKANEKTLAEYFVECGEVEVWMFQPHSAGGVARCISATYEDLFHQPLDLDATRAEVAMEWVRLNKTRMGKCKDIPHDEWPAGAIREFGPAT
jgi:hypothetical protein